MEVTNIELSKKNMLVVARNSIKVMRICCIFRFYFVFFLAIFYNLCIVMFEIFQK